MADPPPTAAASANKTYGKYLSRIYTPIDHTSSDSGGDAGGQVGSSTDTHTHTHTHGTHTHIHTRMGC